MSELIPLRRAGAEVGDRDELHASFDVEPFDLYGRHHEVTDAQADIGVTRLTEGLHVDLVVRVALQTTCDRTLEPTELLLEFGDSEFLSGPNDRDWTLDLGRYTSRSLPSEVPMQVFSPDTEPVEAAGGDDGIDPRWRGLGGLFTSES